MLLLQCIAMVCTLLPQQHICASSYVGRREMWVCCGIWQSQAMDNLLYQPYSFLSVVQLDSNIVISHTTVSLECNTLSYQNENERRLLDSLSPNAMEHLFTE